MGVEQSKVGMVDERRSTEDHDGAILRMFQLSCVSEMRDVESGRLLRSPVVLQGV